MFVMMLASWLAKRFPSLQQYSEYVLPTFVFIATAFGIFTNMLPEPGHQYPVPDVAELEKELEGGGIIIRFAKFTRRVVITINWFLNTIVYSWFYTATNKISTFLPKLKKKA
jgi:hypothetical protein